ncbi:A-kinase anchor protein 17A, partial [Geodia barretti]
TNNGRRRSPGVLPACRAVSEARGSRVDRSKAPGDQGLGKIHLQLGSDGENQGPLHASRVHQPPRLELLAGADPVRGGAGLRAQRPQDRPSPPRQEHEAERVLRAPEAEGEAGRLAAADQGRVGGALPVQRRLFLRRRPARTSSGRPCHKVLVQAFQKFGTVSQVGIYDPTAAAALGRKEEKFSSFGPGSRQFYFEAYIQYEKYAGFNNAMGALKGMSLLRLEEGGKEAVVRIAVDFDKTAFLSERNVRKRRRAEERRREEMEEKRRLEEEKKREEERRRQEEERRREEEAAKRRAEREERRRKKRKQRVAVVTELKNVAVQRRGEAQRLLRTILAGAAEEKYQQEEAEKRARQEREQREEAEQRRRERVAEEGVLRDKLIRNVHQLERRRKEVQRELVLRNISESGSSSRDRRRRSPREHGHGASGVSSAVVAPRHHRH